MNHLEYAIKAMADDAKRYRATRHNIASSVKYAFEPNFVQMNTSKLWYELNVRSGLQSLATYIDEVILTSLPRNYAVLTLFRETRDVDVRDYGIDVMPFHSLHTQQYVNPSFDQLVSSNIELFKIKQSPAAKTPANAMPQSSNLRALLQSISKAHTSYVLTDVYSSATKAGIMALTVCHGPENVMFGHAASTSSINDLEKLRIKGAHEYSFYAQYSMVERLLLCYVGEYMDEQMTRLVRAFNASKIEFHRLKSLHDSMAGQAMARSVDRIWFDIKEQDQEWNIEGYSRHVASNLL